ncbi:efflux RND transporter permease subunit [Paraphotobacterium marinum]|uniref:efflux RND transporter permease subunit n=1 Tax=Paraphotobacterium marinum TaxID=1755811 RepID=UPI0039EAB601
MKLPEICIKHPVFATVLSLLILLVGVFSYNKLETNLYPSYNTKSATVSASISGASAKYLSDNVAVPLINAAKSLPDIKNLVSDCQQGSCKLTINFKDSVDYVSVINKLRSNIDAQMDNMPSTLIDKPTVSDDTGSSGSQPDYYIQINYDPQKYKPSQVKDYLNNNIRNELLRIDGVGALWIQGADDNNARVWLNPNKMSDLNVTPGDVTLALQTATTDVNAGKIYGKDRSYAIVPENTVDNINAIKNLTIKIDDNKNPIRINDVADVALAPSSNIPQIMRTNGKRTLLMQILHRDSANPIKVGHDIDKFVNVTLKKQLPDGISAQLIYNQGTYINKIINKSYETLIVAIILVAAIIYIFMGSLRISIIPIITIPVCIIGTFAFMELMGFSINILSLLAIILAIGLVVDDAIVVVENCFRYKERGLSAYESAIKGSNEIILPIVSMTLTLAIVFIPIAITEGISAALFKQFAFTLAFSVIISGFIALTLSPMMCSKLLTVNSQSNWYKKFNVQFENLTKQYVALLKKCIDKFKISFTGMIVIFILGVIVYHYMPKQLLPTEDLGVIYSSAITPPSGAGRNYNLKYSPQLENLIKKNKNIETNMLFLKDGNDPITQTFLKPWGTRKTNADKIVSELNNSANNLAAYDASFKVQNMSGLSYETGLKLEITTISRNLEHLRDASEKIVDELKKFPGLTNVKSSSTADQLEYKLAINHDKLSLSGVTYDEFSSAINTFLGSTKAGFMKDKNNNQYNIKVQIDKNNLDNIDVLNKIYVNAYGNPIPVSQFVSLTQNTESKHQFNFNGLDATQITADIDANYSPSQIKRYIEENIPRYLNKDETFEFNGAIKQLDESQQSTVIVFVLAIILIYLILSAQFENFIDPLIILFTVPLTLVSGIIALWIGGFTLNVYSNIGLLTLVGLITKHGILLVQFANSEQKKGKTAKEAAINSGTQRLRPIIMTSITMILGAIPLSLSSGPGSLGQINIGVVLVFGLFIGTFFSLFIVPTTYLALDKIKKIDVLIDIFKK